MCNKLYNHIVIYGDAHVHFSSSFPCCSIIFSCQSFRFHRTTLTYFSFLFLQHCISICALHFITLLCSDCLAFRKILCSLKQTWQTPHSSLPPSSFSAVLPSCSGCGLNLSFTKELEMSSSYRLKACIQKLKKPYCSDPLFLASNPYLEINWRFLLSFLVFKV